MHSPKRELALAAEKEESGEQREYYSSPFARMHYEEWKKAQRTMVFDKKYSARMAYLKLALMVSIGGIILYVLYMSMFIGH